MNTQKICSLTFDDGPDCIMTGRILDKLEQYKVVATFFVVGEKIDETTSIVLKRAVDMGCEIGNHSWSYSPMHTMSADEIERSVAMTNAAVERFVGVRPCFFRPPNLAISEVLVNTIDLPFLGGIVANDWDQSTSAETRAEMILSGVEDGTIILLHDVQPEPHPTPEALDIIIPELKRQGYRFLTVSELFRQKGVDPKIKGMLWNQVG